MKDRIKAIRKAVSKEKTITQIEFGEKIGVKGNTITNYENGLRTPSDAVLKAICREYNVNEDWLRTGEGEMFIDLSREEEIAKLTLDLLKEEDDSFKSRVISVLSRMTPEEWKWLEEKAMEVVGAKGKE